MWKNHKFVNISKSSHIMKINQQSRQVMDNVLGKFKGELGYEKSIPGFKHLTEP